MTASLTEGDLFATVVIPTFNGAPIVDEVLHALREQKLDHQFEILVVDSGSTDDTMNILRAHKSADHRVRIHEIPNSEFQHGRTRNLAVSMARGKYVAFLTQDATPASDRWLEFLTEPFALSSDIKGVVGKQIPRIDADTTTRREVSEAFSGLGPDHSIVIHRAVALESRRKLDGWFGFYSDVNSAALRAFLLNEIPYEEVPYAEDQLFGHSILEAGYCKAYAPDAAVLHSNEYGLTDYFARKVDEFSGMNEVLGALPSRSVLKSFRNSFRSTGLDVRFALADKKAPVRARLRGALEAPVRNLLWNLAAVSVARSPRAAQKRFSLERRQRSTKRSIE